MGQVVANKLMDIMTGIGPFFEFMHALWSAFPLAFRWVFSLMFGVAITFVVVKNLIL